MQVLGLSRMTQTNDYVKGLLFFFIQMADHAITSENNEREYNRFIIRLAFVGSIHRTTAGIVHIIEVL